MAIFRKKTTTTEIPELQEYYAAKRANNSVGSWVMALVSLIVTVLIILGLFYGGRWLWRKIQGDDNKVTTTVQDAGDEFSEDVNDAVGTDEGADSTTDESSVDSSGASNSSDSSSSETESTQTGTTGTSSTSTTTPSGSGSSSSESITTTGDSTTASSLPNSGPGDVVAIFAVSTAAGYAVHRYRTIKKQS